LLDHLRSGRDLALVTDGGTPLVSDPGGELAAAWASEGGVVVPIPGASAVLAALWRAASPWPLDFRRFPAPEGKERARSPGPNRLRRAGLRRVRGSVPCSGHARRSGGRYRGERRAAVCRELTKIHGEVVARPLADLAGEGSRRGNTATGRIRHRSSRRWRRRGQKGRCRRVGAAKQFFAGKQPASMDDGRAEVASGSLRGIEAFGGCSPRFGRTRLDRRELYRPRLTAPLRSHCRWVRGCLWVRARPLDVVGYSGKRRPS